MSDDKSKTVQDRSVINVNEDYELRYWTKTLGVDAERLQELVAKVGTSAADIRDYLAKNNR